MDKKEFIPILFYIPEQKNLATALLRVQERYNREPTIAFLSDKTKIEFPESILAIPMPLPVGHIIFAETEKELQHEYERRLKDMP